MNLVRVHTLYSPAPQHHDSSTGACLIGSSQLWVVFGLKGCSLSVSIILNGIATYRPSPVCGNTMSNLEKLAKTWTRWKRMPVEDEKNETREVRYVHARRQSPVPDESRNVSGSKQRGRGMMMRNNDTYAFPVTGALRNLQKSVEQWIKKKREGRITCSVLSSSSPLPSLYHDLRHVGQWRSRYDRALAPLRDQGAVHCCLDPLSGVVST